ncbi:ABC transporter substrate-binding protein [Erythrobacter sp. Alg231-14]|uniref:ABC transporter substrate-binding protein n=1 Tax=Erythrobacter sp. Alg231-14 TaxID=1922225 RepID=UPI000D54B08D
MGRHANILGLKVAGLVFAAGLTSCGGSGSPTGHDPSPVLPTSAASVGETPTILSLNPCLDAILVEVAAPGQILALSHFSFDEGSSSIDSMVAAAFAYTGGTAEEIIALQPDIVFASTFIAPNTRAALERAGLRVETFVSPTSIDESMAQIRDVAAMAQRVDEGTDLIERIEATLPTPQSPPGNDGLRALLWQPGQIVAGEASLVWDIFDRFGWRNHSAAMGLNQADHVSLEMVMSDPPDLLLVAGDQAGQLHPVLNGLDATQVARFEPNLFYCGGPSIANAVARLDEIERDMDLNVSGGLAHDAR